MSERATSFEPAASGVPRNVGADEQVFAAEIKPHRSLGPRGFAIVIGAFATLSALISVPFYLLGAWPVVGFLGLDVLALWIAFRLSFAQARACEQVALSYIELVVRKIAPGGAMREWRFNPSWVRIESEKDEEFGMTRLSVTARESRLAIAEALSPHERADFAEAFGRALATAKAGPRREASNG
ncbi:DUF2244 domain-containing protein [Methylopila sp. M107]|uniref:DUF2244 domain-containing protein n=1 Tax=Methylopila sp. M107 TaxID=1101190 RepID=UPI00037EC515|nr:DUF2244 domain-containing protein [Methylopila sp. M107]